MEWSPHAPPAKEGLEVSADVRTLPHTPPPQEEHMPTKKKKRGACCLNIAASVLLVPAIFAFFRFADEIVGFIAGHVGWMVVVGFLAKLFSKIVFAFAFLPIGTLYKLVHALLPVNEWLAAALYGALSGVIEGIAFAFHRKYSKMNEDGEDAGKIIAKLRGSMSSLVELQASASKWQQFVEIFCVQNAFGVPDTGTMLFYACATDFEAWIFFTTTFLSYLSIGLVKNVAWIIGLRALKDVKSEGFGSFKKVASDVDPVTKWTLLVIGVAGLAFLGFKVFKVVRSCVLGPPPPPDPAAHDAAAAGAPGRAIRAEPPPWVGQEAEGHTEPPVLSAWAVGSGEVAGVPPGLGRGAERNAAYYAGIADAISLEAQLAAHEHAALTGNPAWTHHTVVLKSVIV